MLLLQHPGTIANITDDIQRTPPSLAVLRGSLDCVKILLGVEGINKDARNANDNSIADLVREYTLMYKKEISELLGINYLEDQKVTPSASPSTDVTHNQRDRNGETELHRAADAKDIVQLKKLLTSSGIDINIQSETACVCYLNSALHYAVENSDSESIKLLLEQNNIDINIHNCDGYTPLNASMVHGSPECVKLLLEMPGIKVNVGDYMNCTPLHNAVLYYHPECVKLLLQHPSIKVNMKDDHLNTALHICVKESHLDCLKLLLAHEDINVNIKNSDGQTPLALAQELDTNKTNKQEIIGVLTSHGATK